jgi:hypothetical protein
VSADRSLVSLRMSRVGYTLITVFVGTLSTGTLVVLCFSISACFLSRVIRCFSISRDAAGFMLKMMQMWSLPALIVALLMAMIVQFRGSVVWWNVVLVAGLVSISGFALSVGRTGDLEDASFFVAVSLVLIVGIQLSRLISRLIGKYPI